MSVSLARRLLPPLLGAVSALCASFAVVFSALWALDRSGRPSNVYGLVVASALGIASWAAAALQHFLLGIAARGPRDGASANGNVV